VLLSSFYRLSLRGQVGNTDVSMSTKIDVTSVSNPGTSLSELGSLSASLTPSAIKTLPPELMDIVSMTVRQLTDATEGWEDVAYWILILLIVSSNLYAVIHVFVLLYR